MTQFNEQNFETINAERAAKCEQAAREMNEFFSTLPSDLSDDQKFCLWMSTDSERAEWLAANAPEPITAKIERRNRVSDIHSFDNAPYLKATSTKKVERVGNIRI